MPRCKATTARGRRCLNKAPIGELFCCRHDEEVDFGKMLGTIAGAVVGNILAPGLGGVLVGGATGKWLTARARENDVAKKKVFISFDFDNDKTLKDFMIGQSRLADSPFEIADHSLKEAAPEHNWEQKARAAIQRSDIVLVLVGPQTYRAPGVLKEVAFAREANVPLVQVIGYRDGSYTAVPNAGRLYAWNWENLKNLLS